MEQGGRYSIGNINFPWSLVNLKDDAFFFPLPSLHLAEDRIIRSFICFSRSFAQFRVYTVSF